MNYCTDVWNCVNENNFTVLLAINGGRYCEISYKFLFCKSILIKQRNKAHDLENAKIFLRQLKVPNLLFN